MGRTKLPHNCFQHLDLKIFSPENKTWRPSRVRAPQGKIYSLEGMQAVLSITLMELERIFPTSLYKIVQTGPNSASFTWEKFLNDEEIEQRRLILAIREAKMKDEDPPVVEQPWQAMPGQRAWDNKNLHWVDVVDAYLEDAKIIKYRVCPINQPNLEYEAYPSGLDKEEPC